MLRWLVLLLVGCGGSDPCDPYPGRTCLSLEVRGPGLTFDQIGVDALAGFPLSDGRSPPAPRSFTLPVQVAVLPPDHQFAGAFVLAVRGLFRDATLATDAVHSAVTAGEHQRLIADLLVPDGGLPDLAQPPAIADLAGADLAGVDLAGPDLAQAGDLAVSLTGWQKEPLPGNVSFIEGVWGTSSSDVYAVGIDGAIIHSTGDGTWTLERLGFSSGVSFDCIGGSGADDIFAGGGILNCTGTCPSVLLHSGGDGMWATVPNSPVQSNKGLRIMAIGAVAKNDVHLGVWGGDHTIFHSSDLVTWTPETQPLSPEGLMVSFYTASATSLFASSNSGTVYQSAGDGTWSILDNPGSGCGDMFLFGLSAANVYAVCDQISNNQARFFHFAGSGSFVAQTVDDTAFESKAVGIGGSGPSDLYGAFNFAVKHSSGDGHWKDEPIPSGIGQIHAVWVAPDGQVFAGTDNEMLHKRP